MALQTVSYSGASVPLGGMGQWAGTSAAVQGQASPLNSIRNGTGKYWTVDDLNAGQGSGQTRPMSTFRKNMACAQGSSYSTFTWGMQNMPEVNLQGQFGPVSLQTGNQPVSGTNVRLSGSISGYNGAGGRGGTGVPTENTPQFYAASGSSGQWALSASGTYLTYLYNQGTIYGGGGGGGGGNGWWLSPGGGLGGGGAPGYPGAVAGNSAADPAVNVQYTAQGGAQQAFAGDGNAPLAYRSYGASGYQIAGGSQILFYGGHGGLCGTSGQAGQSGEAGYYVYPSGYIVYGNNGGYGGAAGQSISGTIIYSQHGTHN